MKIENHPKLQRGAIWAKKVQNDIKMLTSRNKMITEILKDTKTKTAKKSIANSKHVRGLKQEA